MPENTLYSIHPTPPTQRATGRNPLGYLQELGGLHPRLVNQIQNLHLPQGGLLDRQMVRGVCLDPNVHVLLAYAVAMAWGGQDLGYFRTSVVSAGLQTLLLQLRGSVNNRAADFGLTQTAAAGIPGLGTSFYTKLLYFFRPAPDAYILDQWTVKSARLLFHPCGVDMSAELADPNTTPIQYEWFCSQLDRLAPILWPTIPGVTGEAAEVAIFDEGYGRGEWRKYVSAHFENEKVARAVRKGAQCQTTHQDFSDGWLVLRVRDGLEIHVIGVGAANVTSLRVLLARIRALAPLRVFFPAGRAALPHWFTAACAALGAGIQAEVEGLPTPPAPGVAVGQNLPAPDWVEAWSARYEQRGTLPETKIPCSIPGCEVLTTMFSTNLHKRVARFNGIRNLLRTFRCRQCR